MRRRADVSRAVLVEAKRKAPDAPQHLVSRPRLDSELGRMVRAHRIVEVTATAGAGKTTAVLEGTRALGDPVAWLTLDESDRAPGRLVTYLDGAIRAVVPELPSAVGDALAAGMGHVEAAALLAEAIPARQLVLVVDELERIAEAQPAQAVLSSLVRYAHPTTTFVLVGRERVYLDVMSRIGPEELGRLDDDALAFTAAEADDAFALRGITSVDPPRVVEAVGGWVAGVLFEAWRSGQHAGGSGGESDPLAGYLAVQILEPLDERERRFLVDTSLLDEVDGQRAEQLGIDGAADLLAALGERHLPVTWRDGGSVMRCHPRFREYLREVLLREPTDRLAGLRRRLATVLRSEGRHEEAVEQLLAAGCPDEALESVEAALPDVLARLDLDVAQRWIDALVEGGQGWTVGLLSAQLEIATTAERFGQAVEAADRLLQDAADGSAPALATEQKARCAWGYWHVGRLRDARALLDDAPSGQVSEVVQYLFSLVDSAPPRHEPRQTGGPLDALVLRIDYVRGRLLRVRTTPTSKWTPASTERIAALRALGELDLTEQLLAGGAGSISNLRFEGTVRVELLIDVGAERAAREALVEGRERIARSGSFVFDVVLQLLEAKLELRLCRDAAAALAVLERVAAMGPVRDYGYLAEQFDLWMGYARLLQHRDREAVEHLSEAVRTMRMSDRILELPTASVYLAEAYWRCGRAAEADAIADVGLEAAGRQGSLYLLLQALRDVPGTLARRLDAERGQPDGRWHDVAAALALHDRARRSASPARVHLREFGAPAAVVDGGVRRARLTKTYALLAYLVEGEGRVSRAGVLDALFDAHPYDSARAYLRQAVHALRKLLPAELELETLEDGLRLSDPGAITTDSTVLISTLAQAATLPGEARVEATEAALRSCDGGHYMDGVECRWVVERRDELRRVIAEARLSMAVAAFEASRFELADRAVTEVVGEEPLNERAWRLMMRVAAARGLESRVMDIYGRYARSLREHGFEPSEATRRLVAGLRH